MRRSVAIACLFAMCGAGSPAYAASDRRAIAAITADGAEHIVAVAATAEACKALVDRLNIGAAAPPADPFTFKCVQMPVKA